MGVEGEDLTSPKEYYLSYPFRIAPNNKKEKSRQSNGVKENGWASKREMYRWRSGTE